MYRTNVFTDKVEQESWAAEFRRNFNYRLEKFRRSLGGYEPWILGLAFLLVFSMVGAFLGLFLMGVSSWSRFNAKKDFKLCCIAALIYFPLCMLLLAIMLQ